MRKCKEGRRREKSRSHALMATSEQQYTFECTVTEGLSLQVTMLQHNIGLCVDGGIRLMGGRARPADGRVEVCYNNVWARVCDSSWSSLEAGVVCKQLGYQGLELLLH